MPQTEYLVRPGGRIAFEIEGAGPLIIAIPGMGDLRSTYRFLVPELVSAGFRVATFDLRGHGDSDARFEAFDDEAAASDAVALAAHLGAPAIILGNSMGAGAAVIAAAQHPSSVVGLVMLGPFVRNPPLKPGMKTAMRLLMAPLWAAAVWRAYLPQLHAGRKPVDFNDQLLRIAEAMKRPGRAEAFSRTTRTDHTPAERLVATIDVPVLVVMGALDPDFPDPAAEAQWIADQTSGEVLMVEDAGHYPQSQRPDVVAPAVTAFVRRVSTDA